MKQLKTKDMVLISIFAALTAVGAFIRIPIPFSPIPFTLQIFFCIFAGLMLGSKKSIISQGLYLLLGLIGLPIFAKGGGLQYIFEPSFGYLLGLIPCAGVIGLLRERYAKKLEVQKMIIASFIGLLILYVIGATYMYIILNLYLGKTFSVMAVLQAGVLPFILLDIVKAILAAVIAIKVIPRLS